MLNNTPPLENYKILIKEKKNLEKNIILEILENYYYTIIKNDTKILIISSKNVNLFDLNKIIFSFISKIVSKFGNFNSKIISENFINITILLDWFLDTGFVLVSNNLVLGSIIKRNLIEKNNFLQIGISKMKISENLINLKKFSDNEYNFKENIFSLSDLKGDNSIDFEFIEELQIFYDKNLKIRRKIIFGYIFCDNNLELFPKLKLIFKKPNKIENISFHQNLLDSLKNFQNEKLFYFYPPNGMNQIINYTMFFNKK